MRERPILFSSPMVRALLDGSKTQTRRVVKLPHNNRLGVWEPTTVGGPNGGRTASGETVPFQGAIWHTRTGDSLICPHGQPSDRLWVRETCRAEELPDGLDGVRYVADSAFAPIVDTQEAAERWIDLNAYRGKKGAVVPAIHMPRWASRLTLEVTCVRVERLQDISEDDAKAEGARLYAAANELSHGGWSHDEWHVHASAKESFIRLWDGLAAPGSDWNANPSVWVVEFKRAA
jgi:hypothetical protein